LFNSSHPPPSSHFKSKYSLDNVSCMFHTNVRTNVCANCSCIYSYVNQTCSL
jgi:hypothetical protein